MMAMKIMCQYTRWRQKLFDVRVTFRNTSGLSGGGRCSAEGGAKRDLTSCFPCSSMKKRVRISPRRHRYVASHVENQNQFQDIDITFPIATQTNFHLGDLIPLFPQMEAINLERKWRSINNLGPFPPNPPERHGASRCECLIFNYLPRRDGSSCNVVTGEHKTPHR